MKEFVRGDVGQGLRIICQHQRIDLNGGLVGVLHAAARRASCGK